MERLSDAERSELWDRWEAGEFQRSVARALDPPPNMERKWHFLTLKLRYYEHPRVRRPTVTAAGYTPESTPWT
jgi:hypothetical protein